MRYSRELSPEKWKKKRRPVLFIMPLSADLKEDPKWLGRKEFYCLIRFQAQVKMTEPAIEMEWMPVWHDLLKFEVKNQFGNRVDVEIWDDDPGHGGGLLCWGRCTREDLLESFRSQEP